MSLVAFIGGRWFDRAAGLVAAALLTLTPDFTAAALKPSADTSELAFQLAAVAAATWAFGAQSRAWALSGGILAGLALQSRDTSLLFIGAAALAWLFLDRQRRKVLLWAVPGLVVAVGAEMLVYWASSGDPLYRFRLALGHVTIPSAELAAHVDTSRSPLFNPEYIAGWRRPAGIQLFWPIDPWLNLLASPRIGVLLIGTMAAAALFARRLDRSWRRPFVLLNACALLVAVLLVYGLAVDPKPRMFACLYAACALTAGALLTAAFRSESRIPGMALFGLIAALDLMMLYRYPTTYHAEQEARRWLAAYPGDIEIDGQTRAYLTLVAEARALPASGSGKPLRITAARRRCDDIATSDAAKGAMLLASTRSRVPGQQGQLCLFRYAAAASAH